MQTSNEQPILFQAGKLKFEIYESRAAAGKAAVLAVQNAMRLSMPSDGDLGVYSATEAT